MSASQRNNLIIKVSIVVVIACFVVFYMVTMSSNAAVSGGECGGGDKNTNTSVHFYVDGQKIDEETYNGSEIIFPPSPRKENHYFTGWYIEAEGSRVPFTASYQVADQKTISVHAGFSSFKEVVKEYLQSGSFIAGGMNYVFSVQGGNVIAANMMPYSNHPFYADVKCKVEYDIFSGIGNVILIAGGGSEKIGFDVVLDFSQLDYSDIYKRVSLEIGNIQFESGKGEKIVDDARAAVSYLGSQIALAVDGLIRHIANVEQYSY